MIKKERETSWARKIQFVLDLFAEPFSNRNSISGESLYRVRANINGRKSQKAIESLTTIFHWKKVREKKLSFHIERLSGEMRKEKFFLAHQEIRLHYYCMISSE
jgi:hypothetical protein